MLGYITTLNLVRLGIKHKYKFIKIIKNRKSSKILHILLKFNIIYGWTILQKKNFSYYLVYCKPGLTNIHTFLRPNRKLNIKYKSIKILINRYSTASIFLSTPNGILSINEAYIQKIGGFLFFRVI